jgi:hypothetical protein
MCMMNWGETGKGLCLFQVSIQAFCYTYKKTPQNASIRIASNHSVMVSDAFNTFRVRYGQIWK